MSIIVGKIETEMKKQETEMKNQKVKVKVWSKNTICRYYVTVDGRDAGYFQVHHTHRGGGYYNNHRKIKGDNTVSQQSWELKDNDDGRLVGEMFLVDSLDGIQGFVPCKLSKLDNGFMAKHSVSYR